MLQNDPSRWWFSGFKTYIGANPTFTHESTTTVVHSKVSSESNGEFVDAGGTDEFYDAIAADSSSEDDEDSDNDVEIDSKVCVF